MRLPRRKFLALSAGAVGAGVVMPSCLAPGTSEGAKTLDDGDGWCPEGRSPRVLAFAKEEYAGRRARFIEAIPDGIAVFLGSLRGRQNNELRYLSGVEVPGTVLVVDGTKKESTLFYTTHPGYLLGENSSPDLALKPLDATGVQHHHAAAEFSAWLAERLEAPAVLYTPFRSEVPEPEVSTGSEWDGRPKRYRRFVEVLKDRFPGHPIRDCSEQLWEQRRFKTPAEVDVIRRAGRIGASAMVAIMKAGRPGQYEYKLSALYEYTCKRQGARELAFDTIISSAENHRYLHYCQYNRRLVDGDFLVVDAGPKWLDYCMDTTISFPINGRFSARQREIYEACLEISKGCLARYRPGLTGYEIGAQVRSELATRGFDFTRSEFTRMRFFKEGGITHYVGLEPHDAGGPDLPPDRALEAGMVFACDVFGTWPDEDLGVRVENTVLVTDTGCEVLNPGIPREIEAIEALMRG